MNQQNSAAGPAVIPLPLRAPAAPAGPPTLKLGDVNRRFALPCGDSLEGPVHVEPKLSEAYLAALGIHAAGRERGAPLFHEHQFPAICDALIAAAAKASSSTSFAGPAKTSDTHFPQPTGDPCER